ncbi:hypothetical protein COB28_00585 [Candidatus Dependentiae bacterium]|nr:MAG: hypothetical protein COB28_00585 [Candidatus Dependentiae bacterium]
MKHIYLMLLTSMLSGGLQSAFGAGGFFGESNEAKAERLERQLRSLEQQLKSVDDNTARASGKAQTAQNEAHQASNAFDASKREIDRASLDARNLANRLENVRQEIANNKRDAQWSKNDAVDAKNRSEQAKQASENAKYESQTACDRSEQARKDTAQLKKEAANSAHEAAAAEVRVEGHEKSATASAKKASDSVAQVEQMQTKIEKDIGEAATMVEELRNGAKDEYVQAQEGLNDDRIAKETAMNQELLRKEIKLQKKMHYKLDEKKKEDQKDLMDRKKDHKRDLMDRQYEKDEKLQKAQLKASKEWWNDTWPEIQKGVGSGGKAILDFASDGSKMKTVVLSTGGISALYYLSKHGIAVASKVVQKHLMTPKLVTDTNIPTLFDRVANSLFNPGEISVDFDRLILAPSIKNQVMDVAQGAKSITAFKDKFSEVNYQNVCFYGPPGTGKTMAAKMLAGYAGMKYAYINGGDVAKLKRSDAILQIEQLFQWANASNEGLLLFIDEAESFLCNRETASENLKLMVNAFIAQCGTSSKKFMIATATNHASLLDSAVRSRIEHFIPFEYPGKDERRAIINLYLESFARNNNAHVSSIIDTINLDSIIEKTVNFSGRDLEKMVNDLIIKAKMHNDGHISDDLFQSVAQTWKEMLPIKRKMAGE